MMLGSKTFALTVTRKNPFQIGCADKIFAIYSKFSYGQRSKCADLLNSYNYSILYRKFSHMTMGKYRAFYTIRPKTLAEILPLSFTFLLFHAMIAIE